MMNDDKGKESFFTKFKSNPYFLWGSIGILVVILIVFAVFMFSGDDAKAPGPSYDMRVKALQDDVYYKNIDTNGQWMQLTGSKGLDKNVWVKTESGEAKIIFNSGIYTVLAPGTEVYVKEVANRSGVKYIRLEQESGKIWNRLFKFAGKADYAIDSGDVVASVRGTAFGMSLEDGVVVAVGDGNVQVDTDSNEDFVTEGLQFKFKEGKGTKGPMDDDSWFSEQMDSDLGFIEERKEYFRKKYESKLNMAKRFTSAITDEMVENYLTIAAWEGMNKARETIERDFGMEKGALKKYI